VGGGGLLAGVAAYVKAVRPEIKVIGVEAKDAEAMTESLKKGERVILDQVGLFADGAAVKQVGEHTFKLAQQFVDEMIVVDNDAICAAIKDVFEDTRSILEPAGALATAGMKEYVERNNLHGKTLVAIASGANMNFDRLRFVAERAELGEHHEAVLAVTIPEQAGAFKTFCRLLGNRNITEFNYRFSDPKEAHIFVGLAISNATEIGKLIYDLAAQGLNAIDLTDNEMAKLHLRHLVGGRAPQAVHEVVYRFEFPEKPGALMKFLDTMGHDWNISLFHYRNHGADFGRVLVGMQVPPSEQTEFFSVLTTVGLPLLGRNRKPSLQTVFRLVG
jgi:threonine dehydratase